MAIDRAYFFPYARTHIFKKFTQPQVDGMNFILDAWEASGFSDLRWLAYMLATAYVETAHTMQPIHEMGSKAYFTRRYDIDGDNPRLARRLGNYEPGDGARYAGRGFVQLTGRANYSKMSRLTGVDLVADPDQAMNPEIAAKIMLIGMTDKAADTFSGVNLQKYFGVGSTDWVGARHVINGTDHAAMIADIAEQFFYAVGGSYDDYA